MTSHGTTGRGPKSGAGRGARAVLGALVALALLLAWGATPPARAQVAHVHNWVAGSAPAASRKVLHMDGREVTATAPAARCEVLRLDATYTGGDQDVDPCSAPGCTLSGASGFDRALTIPRWRDNGAPGIFVYEWQPGHWDQNEALDPDGTRYGKANSLYYRVGYNQPDNATVKIEYQLDDNDPTYGFTVQNYSTPDRLAGYDDPPVWLQAGSFPVQGDMCEQIQFGRRTGPKENCVCLTCSNQPAASTVNPLSGNVSFAVPVTSWGYRGETLSLALHYNSQSIIDPTLSFHQPMHPAALSDTNPDKDYNPKWNHNFAQWIEVVSDSHAVWHRGDGSQTAFEQYWDNSVTPPAGPYWRSGDGTHTLTSSGSITSPELVNEGEKVVTRVMYGSFTLRHSSGTTYTFDNVKWQSADHPPYPAAYAIPYFRLRQVADRQGRTVSVAWGASGVTSVLDGNGRGLTFNYANGLIASVADPAGRTHTLSYTSYATPSGGSQPKLTGVTVLGAGSPDRARYNWSFTYGGQANDLIVGKTEPGGKTVSYVHETVNMPRLTANDWDGRMARCSWSDNDGVQPVTREIVRNGTTLTYPGGNSYAFTYTGPVVSQVQHVNTGASVNYTYDTNHNLSAVWTSLESGSNPLVRLTHAYGGPSGRQITATTATDILGNSGSTQFNALNEPTEVRAKATAGSGRADQVTQFIYDGGGALSVGNLTRIVSALGTPSEEGVDLEYGDSLFPGLPTAAVDSMGRRSTVTYSHKDGTPLVQATPGNLLPPTNDPERNPSTVRIDQNADELPSILTSMLGRKVEITYNAESPGSSRLVVTYKFMADLSTRRVTLNASGQVVESVDEAGVRSTGEYSPGGQLLRATAAAGTASERTLRYYYNAQGDLSAFDPPGGSAGRVSYEYVRYNQSYGYPVPGAPQKSSPEVYVGQVTRVVYPDGTSTYTGYNGAEEPVWGYTQDGRYVNLVRDAAHRVYRVEYPASPYYPAFSVTSTFDEFGRVSQLTDANGTTTYTYDDLNRVRSMAPAVGRGVTYDYLKDPALQRWITRVTLAGVGSWESREDGKGREAQVVNPFGQITSRRFYMDGTLRRETRANGSFTDYTITNRDWLASIEHRRTNGTTLDMLTFGYTDANGVYDRTGHVQSEQDAGGNVHRFSYNSLYELTSETHPDFGTISYALDANGNRTSKTAGGVTTYYGHDAQNKLLWTNQGTNAAPTAGQATPYRRYTYDPLGQPTQIERRDSTGSALANDRYDWDGSGKLRRVRDTPAGLDRYTAQYDGGGTRVSSVLGGVPHTYSYGMGLLHDDAGSTTYTPGVGQRKNGLDHTFHEDWRTSTRYLMDATGNVAPTAYRYDAYGNTTASGGPDQTSFKFAGGVGYESDGPNGLQLLGARYYDPGVGRFLNPDPIGFDGGLNLYAYCENDPVNLVDPDGLQGFPPGYNPNTWKTIQKPGKVGPMYQAPTTAQGRVTTWWWDTVTPGKGYHDPHWDIRHKFPPSKLDPQGYSREYRYYPSTGQIEEKDPSKDQTRKRIKRREDTAKKNTPKNQQKGGRSGKSMSVWDHVSNGWRGFTQALDDLKNGYSSHNPGPTCGCDACGGSLGFGVGGTGFLPVRPGLPQVGPSFRPVFRPIFGL